MNYKELFHIALTLISSPARAWEEISLEDRRKVSTAFVYPMIGLCGLSVFVGALMTQGWGGPQSFEYAMRECCGLVVALFLGYFLSAYLVNGLQVRMLEREADLSLAQQLVGYSMVVVFLLKIVLGILPSLAIFSFLLFYTLYIVWEACKKLVVVSDSLRLRFTLVSTLIILLGPELIHLAFNKLTVLLG